MNRSWFQAIDLPCENHPVLAGAVPSAAPKNRVKTSRLPPAFGCWRAVLTCRHNRGITIQNITCRRHLGSGIPARSLTKTGEHPLGRPQPAGSRFSVTGFARHGTSPLPECNQFKINDLQINPGPIRTRARFSETRITRQFLLYCSTPPPLHRSNLSTLQRSTPSPHPLQDLAQICSRVTAPAAN
jgi:hypothetical protein